MPLRIDWEPSQLWAVLPWLPKTVMKRPRQSLWLPAALLGSAEPYPIFWSRPVTLITVSFFHSLAFACLVGHGVYKAWQWEPETETQEWIRMACMALGGAYLVHLAMDLATPKGLPVI
jgi:hypothetical protein